MRVFRGKSENIYMLPRLFKSLPSCCKPPCHACCLLSHSRSLHCSLLFYSLILQQNLLYFLPLWYCSDSSFNAHSHFLYLPNHFFTIYQIYSYHLLKSFSKNAKQQSSLCWFAIKIKCGFNYIVNYIIHFILIYKVFILYLKIILNPSRTVSVP